MIALGMPTKTILAVFYPETDVIKMREIRKTFQTVRHSENFLFPVELFLLLLFFHADEAFLHASVREKLKVLIVDFVNIDILAFLFQPLIIGKRLRVLIEQSITI